MSSNIQIVYFNLLVQIYANSNQPKDRSCLNDSYRWTLLIDLLEKQIQNGTNVLCFQEVSWEWRNRLVSFFRKHGYDFTYDNYGHKYNDYMGVFMAWNNKIFSAEEESIVVGDHIKPKSDVEEPVLTTWEWIKTKLCCRSKPQRFTEYNSLNKSFKDAKRRRNVLQCVHLTDESNKNVSIMNYHMPCAFYDLEQMRLHIDFIVNKVQEYAKTRPVILGGDFNTQPSNQTYNNFSSLTNTYVAVHGKQPKATTNAVSMRGDKISSFIGTLDHCFFIGEGLTPTSAEATDASKPMPNMEWPSDHSMMKFGFELK
jgi:hypothetical protein